MSPDLPIVLVAGFLIAYVNGANDVSKGIATLVGSGVTDYRSAIRWGTVCTALGALGGASLARGMLGTFGTGLLAPGTAPSWAAALATILGAAAWVLIATRSGLPVSTTHAIVGSIAGVGLVAYGPAGVDWNALGGKVVLPLVLGPVVSLVLTSLLLRSAAMRTARSVSGPDCVCAELEPAPTWVAVGGTAASLELVSPGVRPRLSVGTSAACAVERPRALRLTIDHAHWLTSGATSFARGMNDAPKMVALLLAAGALSTRSPLSPPLMFLLVTLGMVAGSIAGGRRVTHVLAERITRLDHREGFLANLVTAALVGAGAMVGLPMSTTQVSSSAIVAAGTQDREVNWQTVRGILLAWLVTVPAAAALGIFAFGLTAIGRA